MTALRDLLAHPNLAQKIAFLVEITYRDPVSDTVTTKRITDKRIAAGDAPTGYLWGLLGPDPDNPDVGPGGRHVSAEADELGGILSSTVAPIVLSNTPVSQGGVAPLDWLRAMTVAGRSVRVMAGANDEDPETDWEPLSTGLAESEPEFNRDRNIVTLRVESALGQLDQDLNVENYVGEPSALRALTSTANATVANNSAHHLTSYTLAGRFQHDPTGAVAVAPRLSLRQTSSTAENWFVRLGAFNGANAGRVVWGYSSGGVANALNIGSTSGIRLDDGKPHWWLVSRRDDHAYLMIDGEVQAESLTPAVPDLPTAGISFLFGFHANPSWMNDHRILNHYLAPDEARAWMAVRSPGTEQGLVGLWRGDDNGGSTLTDYSSTAAHATISGVENTAFQWVSSDLGTPELAGNSMPAVIGQIWNFLCDLVDAFRERWRFNDPIGIGASITITARDEGELLTGGGTDYNVVGSEVLALTAEAGEPLTAGISLPFSDLDAPVRGVLQRILTVGTATRPGRGPLAVADLNSAPLDNLYQAPSGIATRRAAVGEIVRPYLQGSLGFLSLRRDGTMRADAITPPVSPSPRDGACLEFTGSYSAFSRVLWPTREYITGSAYTIALWVKNRSLGPHAQGGGAAKNRITLMDFSGSGITGIRLILDLSFGVPRVILENLSSETVTSAPFVALPEVGFDWFFLQVAANGATPTTRFDFAVEGGTLATIGTSSAALASLSGTNRPLQVGQDRPLNDATMRGSIFEPSIWTGARSLAQGQTQMDSGLIGNETNLKFYSPLDGLAASSVEDKVNAAAGTVSGDVVERPDLTLHLENTPRPWNEKKLRPAKTINVHYRKNYAVLDPGQIAAAVPQDQAQDLQQPHRTEPWESPEIAEDYEDARDIEIDSPWYDRTGAQATMRLARHRFGEDRHFASVGRDAESPNREGILLEIGDEVRVYGHQELATGPTYRVVSNNSDHAALDCELGLWR